MRAISQVIALAVAAGPFTIACDEAARDVKEGAAEARDEVRRAAGGAGSRVGPNGIVVDIDSQKVKEELREAGAALKRGAEIAAGSVKEAADEVEERDRAEEQGTHQVQPGAGGAR